MQGDGWQVKTQQSQVLDDECVNADTIQVMNQPFHLFQLIVIDEGIDRRIDAGTEPMGIIAGAADVIKRVGRIGTCPVM